MGCLILKLGRYVNKRLRISKRRFAIWASIGTLGGKRDAGCSIESAEIRSAAGGGEGDAFPGDEEFPDEETLQIWDEWVEAVDSIKRPITWEEAEILIKCSPTEHMAGVEWTFLHCIESVFASNAIEGFRKLIEKCNSDLMKNMLLERLQNYIISSERTTVP